MYCFQCFFSGFLNLQTNQRKGSTCKNTA
jgi:hypothetical protein